MSNFLTQAVIQAPLQLEALDASAQRQLIEAHRAISGLEHAVRFAEPRVAKVFREWVWLFDGIAAAQLDGEPVRMQTILNEPNHAATQLAIRYQALAREISGNQRLPSVTRVIALDIADQLAGSRAALKRDESSNEALQLALAQWENFMSDGAGDADGLVLAALSDAMLRQIPPFTSSNHAAASLLISAVLREEQVLAHAPLCLATFFSRHPIDFNRSLQNPDYTIRFYLRAMTECAYGLIEQLDALQSEVLRCRQVIESTLPRAPLDAVIQAVCLPVCTNADLIEAGISRRQTSASYLKKLSAVGLLNAHKAGKETRYSNSNILKIFNKQT